MNIDCFKPGTYKIFKKTGKKVKISYVQIFNYDDEIEDPTIVYGCKDSSGFEITLPGDALEDNIEHKKETVFKLGHWKRHKETGRRVRIIKIDNSLYSFPDKEKNELFYGCIDENGFYMLIHPEKLMDDV